MKYLPHCIAIVGIVVMLLSIDPPAPWFWVGLDMVAAAVVVFLIGGKHEHHNTD